MTGSPRPRAMILAAGYGTRLGPLARLRPKPMMPVMDVPLVKWAALWLRHHGVREVVVNLHHLGEQIVRALGDGSDLGLTVHYTHEEGRILGTGGGLRNARELLDPGDGAPIVVVNGKVLLDLDLSVLVATHRAADAEATMAFRRDENMEQWGTPLHLDEHRNLGSLLGEDRPGAKLGEPLMFTGVHVFEPRFLDRVPPEGEQCIIRTAYRELFREGSGPHGFVHDGYWWEHSTPERYREGVFNLLRAQVNLNFEGAPRPGVHPDAHVDEGARVEGPVYVGAGARVEAGARVGPLCQIGAGAVVAAGVHVKRAIVWEDVHLSRDAQDEVVARSGA